MKLATSVGNIADVDDKLASDAMIKRSLRDEAADLLESAGFDRAAYLKWVSSGEPTSPG